MNEEKIIKELEESIRDKETKLKSFTQDLNHLQELEREIKADSNIDLKGMKDIIEDLIQHEHELEKFNGLQSNMNIIKDTFHREACNNMNDLVQDLSNLETLQAQFYPQTIFEMMNKICHSFHCVIESNLLMIKFPIFEGMRVDSILAEVEKENTNVLVFLERYLFILGKVTSETFMKEEILSKYISNRIWSSIVIPTLQLNDDKISIDIIEAMSKYLKIALDNINEIISYKTKEKTKEINSPVIKVLLASLSTELTARLKSNVKFMSCFESPITMNKAINVLINFNKHFNKIYSYDTFNLPSLSDLIVTAVPNENLFELLRKQESFSSHVILNEIKNLMTSTIEERVFNDEEIYEVTKTIAKDNYNLLLLLKINPYFVNCLENNFSHCLRNFIHLCRSCYNEEVHFFSLKSTVNHKKLLFVTNILLSFLNFTSRLFSKLDEVVKDQSMRECLNKSLVGIVTETNNIVQNNIKIIGKVIKSNALDKFVHLFSYEQLIKLDEDIVNREYINAKNTIKLFIKELDEVKISEECENIIITNLLLDWIENICTEVERSLKRLPEGKHFNKLIECYMQLIQTIATKSSLTESTLNSLKKPMSRLRNLFSLLNMNNA